MILVCNAEPTCWSAPASDCLAVSAWVLFSASRKVRAALNPADSVAMARNMSSAADGTGGQLSSLSRKYPRTRRSKARGKHTSLLQKTGEVLGGERMRACGCVEGQGRTQSGGASCSDRVSQSRCRSGSVWLGAVGCARSKTKQKAYILCCLPDGRVELWVEHIGKARRVVLLVVPYGEVNYWCNIHVVPAASCLGLWCFGREVRAVYA
jgi:hypothetical protein